MGRGREVPDLLLNVSREIASRYGVETDPHALTDAVLRKTLPVGARTVDVTGIVEPLLNNLTKNLSTKSERRVPRGHPRGAIPRARTKSTASAGTTPRERIKVAADTKPPRGVVSERVSRASDHRRARRTRQVTERTEQTAPRYSLGISTSGGAEYFGSN